MTTTEFVSSTYLKSNGKLPTFTSGSTKWLKIVAVGNYYIKSWEGERGVDWLSLYNPAFSLGTVTATDTYEIDTDTVRKFSQQEGDSVRIDHTDGVGYTDYDIIPADRLKDKYAGQNKESYGGYYCSRINDQLVFNHKFLATDRQFGGSILAPIFTFADLLKADNDVVPVDDPNWLVTITAAEIVRNDITRQNQYPNLIAEANEMMQVMKDDQDSQIETVTMPWTPRATEW